MIGRTNASIGSGGGGNGSMFVYGDIISTDDVSATNGVLTKTGVWGTKPNPSAHNLPAGYTELIFISATSNQYIDTGLGINQNFGIEFDGFTSASDQAMFGANSSAPYITMNDESNGIRMRWNSTSYTHVTSPRTRKKIKVNKGVWSIDGTVVKTMTQGTFSSGNHMYLFGRNNVVLGIVDWKMTGDCYECKIWDNDVLVRHFIPCKNASNVAGLYDIINGQFYASDSGTDFVAGDVLEPLQGFRMNKLTLCYWTVSATHSGATKTQSVLVPDATEVDVNITFP